MKGLLTLLFLGCAFYSNGQVTDTACPGINLYNDKVAGTKNYQSIHDVNGISVVKITGNNVTNFALIFEFSVGKSVRKTYKDAEDLFIEFEDDELLKFDSIKIHCFPKRGGVYEIKALLLLTEETLEIFKSRKIKMFEMGARRREIGSQDGITIIDQLNCILKL